MNIFVLNCGSSSVKYKLYAMEGEKVLAEGRVERWPRKCRHHTSILRQGEGHQNHAYFGAYGGHPGKSKSTNPPRTRDHQERPGDRRRWSQVVHGGESFSDSVLIDGRTKEILDSLAELAPLHNPANVIGIRAAEKLMPKTPQVAVFDTAFHSTIPPLGFLYAIPYSVYQRHKVRRYGFHGTSHKYVSQRAAELMGRKIEDLKIISCHLGNGASIAAIADGKSIDTSMGFTPLEGLMMGTRSGDIDPGAIFYIMRKEELNLHEIDSMLNKHSGLYGMAGVSDMRDIEKGIAEGDKLCKVAFDIYEYRIRKYIGSYIAAMNGVDAIVFTAGIGENTPSLRTALVANLPYLGITLDEEQNKKRGEDIEISTPDSRVRVFVIPTDEELVIARDTASIVS